MADAQRFCPICGSVTAELFCPTDKVSTFTLRSAGSEEAKFGIGDLVAGKFRVARKLGQGGFGAVYEAEHTGGLGNVALKMLTLADQSIDDVRRFYREVQVTAQLRHANTVRVFDVGQVESGALYIAMELLAGRSLEDTLRHANQQGHVLSQADAIGIASDVLKSLSEAHSKGLVHRDLKPANLMVTEVDGERVVKVLDFGIAHVQDSSLTGTGRALGTPAYMSPEQCSGATLDARSDLYALGVILYRCVVGKTPFSDPNPLTVMFAHAAQQPPDLLANTRTPLSGEFVACVKRALAKTPEERFANAKDMRLALEAAATQPLAHMPAQLPVAGEDPARKPLTSAELAAYSRRATGHTPALVVTGDVSAQAHADVTNGLTLDARTPMALGTPSAPVLALTTVPAVAPAAIQPELLAGAAAGVSAGVAALPAKSASKLPLVLAAGGGVAFAVAIAIAALPLRDRGEAAATPVAVAPLVVPGVPSPLPEVEALGVTPAAVAVQQLAPTPTAQVEVPALVQPVLVQPVLVQPTTAPAAEALQPTANRPKVQAAVPKARAPSKKKAIDASLPE